MLSLALAALAFPSLLPSGWPPHPKLEVKLCKPRPGVRNPVFNMSHGRVRDPAVHVFGNEYELYFTHYRGNPAAMFNGGSAKAYTVRFVRTVDWRTFSEAMDVSPPGFASPDAPVVWRNSTIIAFQAYPDKSLGGKKSGLYFSRLRPGAGRARTWSKPRSFLREVLELPWNSAGRAIDPTLIVDSHDRLHCFFVGSSVLDSGKSGKRANLLGHAVTDDAQLKRWTVLSSTDPVLGVSPRAPDGVENVAVFRRGKGRSLADGGDTLDDKDTVRALTPSHVVEDEHVLIFSEGLREQHLAYALSTDGMATWHDGGQISIEPASWTAGRYGAPFVWRERGCWWMAMMGESEVRTHSSAVGLLHSIDGVKWDMLSERQEL